MTVDEWLEAFTFKPDHLWVEHLLAGAAPAEKRDGEGTLPETGATITHAQRTDVSERQTTCPQPVV